MEGEADAGTPLFAIFLVSLLSLFLVPYTIYKLCSVGSTDQAARPWESAANKKAGALKRSLGKLLTPSSIVLILGWLFLLGLLWYVQRFAKDLAPFDPYDILKLDRGATEQDVKKAYRRLSLQFHPDKNQDPAAVPIFLQVSQAYRALTDEVARRNWEQFGHPDGKQAMDIGIALPAWLMGGDSNGPIVLAALVIIGIVLPLGAAAWFLFSSSKYMGPNQVMQETLDIFIRSKFAVKESQSLARIPDTLVYAMEFIMLATPSDQAAALEELRKETLRTHADLKDKPQFFKRKASIVKVHMLLLAHMDRQATPPALRKDLEFVLRKSTILLEEIVKIANIPRYSPYGWLTPTVGAVEMLQCLTRGVSIGSRRTFTHGKATGDSQAPMLQLPHVDMDLIKRLGRRRVRGLAELLDLPGDERLAALESAGLNPAQAGEALTALLSIPVVTVAAAALHVEGEDAGAEILEEDIVTCTVRLLLRRPSHGTAGFLPPKGSSVLAYAPHCPILREERWYVILADAANNLTLSYTSASLLEAETAGFAAADEPAQQPLDVEGACKQKGRASDQPAESTTEAAPSAQQPSTQAGQQIDLKFRAPRQGKYDLTLYIMSDCWIGCDRTLALKLKVNELTRAEREGRTHRGKPLAVADAASEDGAAPANGHASEADEDDSDEEDEYDSEEGSTEESGSEAGSDGADSQSASSTEAPLLRDVEESEN